MRGNPASSPVHVLSDRELQVLRLIAGGQTTKKMAGHLRLSIKAVETHGSRIKEKLGIGSAAELIAAAARWLSENSSE